MHSYIVMNKFAGSDLMGIQNWCICPDVLQDYINDWFFIHTVNDTAVFYGTQWQLMEVGVNYIIVRRWVVDIGGYQNAILFCHQIVGLSEAPPDFPPNN